MAVKLRLGRVPRQGPRRYWWELVSPNGEARLTKSHWRVAEAIALDEREWLAARDVVELVPFIRPTLDSYIYELKVSGVLESRIAEERDYKPAEYRVVTDPDRM